MNRSILRLSAVALAFGAAFTGSARADDITIDPVPFVSTATRAQVQAELKAYKAAGINPWATHYNPLAHFRSTQSRAQVQAEFLANREAVAAMNGEDSGSQYLASAGSRLPAGVLVAAESDGQRQ